MNRVVGIDTQVLPAETQRVYYHLTPASLKALLTPVSEDPLPPGTSQSPRLYLPLSQRVH